MNFYRGTAPIYQESYQPSFDSHVRTSHSNMAFDVNVGLSAYLYCDVTPGTALWYGFTARYGAHARSAMQVLNVAALARPASLYW